MPQASDELRAKWGIDPDKAMGYLTARGFKYSFQLFEWTYPDRPITDEENSALDFLFQEWDY